MLSKPACSTPATMTNNPMKKNKADHSTSMKASCRRSAWLCASSPSMVTSSSTAAPNMAVVPGRMS